MSYIFVDESGQFNTSDDGDYFVVGSFTVGDVRRTNKRFRGFQRNKFPRKMRYQPEIKFSEIDITDDLRKRTLKFISDLDIRIRFVYLKRKNIPQDYLRGGKIKSGILYTNVIGELIEEYLPINDKELRVFCDQRHLKGLKRSEFSKMLEARLAPQVSKDTCIQIEMIDSTSNENIQIADWVTGAFARYIEKKDKGEEFYSILKNNLLDDGKELFK